MKQKSISIIVLIIIILSCSDVKISNEIDEIKANHYKTYIGNVDSINYYKNSDVHYIKHTNIKCFIDGVLDDSLYYDVRTLPDCKLIEHIHRDSLIN